MAKRDYYEILGVSKNATPDEIKKAYRKVAMKYHPDRNPDNKEAEEMFKEAAEAYEILSTPETKQRYDQFGHAGLGGTAGYRGGGMSMEDIFDQFGDIFGGFGGFGDFFGGGTSRRSGKRGSNLRIKVKLKLDEIAEGVQKKIKVKKQLHCDSCSGTGAKSASDYQNCSTCNGVGQIRQIKQTIIGPMQTSATCPSCRGTGKVIIHKCDTCRGEGRVYGEETITIDIPAGVSEGVQLSMSGRGNAGENGAPSGDLIISIEEVPHKFLKREGSNVYYALHLNFADAALGTQLEVPTISGKAKIKVPAGTQSGKIFRLRGKGLPSINSYGTGDQLIEVNIWTPKQLSSKERELLEQLRDSENFNPKPSKNDKGFFDKVRDYFS